MTRADLADLRRPLDRPLQKAPVIDPIIAGKDVIASSAVQASHAASARQSDKTKLTIRIDPELHGRARAAFLADGPARGIGSLSDWVADAIRARVEEVEATRNGGAPFQPMGIDVIPKGRMGGLT